MKAFIEKITRPTKKVSDIFPLSVILSLIVTFGGSFLSLVLLAIIKAKKFIDLLTGDAAVTDFAVEYLSFIGIWILILIVIFAFKGNRKMWNALKHNGGGNSLKGLLAGLILGFTANGINILLSALSGDIKLSFYGFDIRCLLVFIIAVFIQSGAEELADRFYLYQKLRRRYRSPLVAILGNALVFAAMHIMNPGFTLLSGIQIFMSGIICSLLVYYYDALWAAMAFHMSWNFTQNIIFGLPNSGVVSAYSIFKLEAASARNGLFYNVNFGVEGSIGATLVLVALAVAIWLMNRNKPEKNDIWKEAETTIQKLPGQSL